jgi:hypothetical protein
MEKLEKKTFVSIRRTVALSVSACFAIKCQALEKHGTRNGRRWWDMTAFSDKYIGPFPILEADYAYHISSTVFWKFFVVPGNTGTSSNPENF